jgi:hypothetical protein
MRALTKKQEDNLAAAWERGLSDKIIAKKLRLDLDRARAARVACGITRAMVTQNRYDTWIRLIGEEIPLTEIARLYAVNVKTIRLTLANKRDFSFREFKKKRAQEKTKTLNTPPDGAAFRW